METPTIVRGRSPRKRCPQCGERRVCIAYDRVPVQVDSVEGDPYLVACRPCLKEGGLLRER